jgi:hypothetical protein
MTALGVEKTKEQPQQKTKAAFGKTVHPTFERAVNAAGFGAGQQRKPDVIYHYENTDGNENFCIIRWNTEHDKITRPISKVEDGYIVGSCNNEQYPIYRLPEIINYLKSCEKTARLYICEGEKATNAAVSVGLPATTSAFGSNNATKTDWSILDKITTENNLKLEIVIFPDNDQSGQDYADSLVGLFTKFKSSPMVKIVSFTDFSYITGIEHFPESGDFYDFLELLDSKSNDDILKMTDTMVESSLPETEIVDDRIEWESFPVDLLPESIGRLCAEAAKAKNIEPIYVAINAIAAVASVIGSAYKVMLKRDWKEPAILWTCLVCESGSGKTPGLDSAVEPLRLLQKQADDSFDNQYNNYETENKTYELEYEEWKRHRKNNSVDPPQKPESPKMETFLADDATLEAIAEILETNPFGILLLKDELAGWFNSFDCYRSNGGAKDLPSWLSIHGGRPFRINRKTGKKIIRSDNPAVSLCGGIQPNVLFRIVKGNEDFFDSGLTARILFAMPPDKPSHWTEVETSDEAIAKYETIFRTLWQWRRDESKPTPENPLLVQLSPDAKEQFVRFYNSNTDERSELTGDMKASWAKFTSYAARLALIFHVVQRIEDGGAMHLLQGDAMQRAIRLISWFKRESVRILEFLRQTKCNIDFETNIILEVIEKNGGTITARELQHHRKKYRVKGGVKLATAVLDDLVQNGKLRVTSTQSGNGKSLTCYSLI